MNWIITPAHKTKSIASQQTHTHIFSFTLNEWMNISLVYVVWCVFCVVNEQTRANENTKFMNWICVVIHKFLYVIYTPNKLKHVTVKFISLNKQWKLSMKKKTIEIKANEMKRWMFFSLFIFVGLIHVMCVCVCVLYMYALYIFQGDNHSLT